MAVRADLRDQIEKEILRRPDVSQRDMMGTKAYMVRNRMFAFWVADGLVARLPDHARQEFVDRREGVEFQGPQGRGTEDWVRLTLAKKADVERAVEGAKQAYEYVRGSGGKQKGKRKTRR